MLPRTARLPYSEFRSRGYRTITTPFFALKIKSGFSREKKNRMGIIISVAAVKSAARRNFWKRHAKADFMLVPDAGNDFLLIFSGGIKKYTVKKFKEAFLRAAMQ